MRAAKRARREAGPQAATAAAADQGGCAESEADVDEPLACCKAWLEEHQVTIADFLDVTSSAERGMHMQFRALQAPDASGDEAEIQLSALLAAIPAEAILSDADVPHVLKAPGPDDLVELQDPERMVAVAAAADLVRASGWEALQRAIAAPDDSDPAALRRLVAPPARMRDPADFREASPGAEAAGGVAAEGDAGRLRPSAIDFWKHVHGWTGAEDIQLFVCLVRKGQLDDGAARHFRGYVMSLPGFPGSADGGRLPDDPTFWSDDEISRLLGSSELATEARAVKLLLRSQVEYILGPRFSVTLEEWSWARSVYVSRHFGGSYSSPLPGGAPERPNFSVKRGSTQPVLLPGIDIFNHALDYPVQVLKLADDSVALVFDIPSVGEAFRDGVHPGMEVFSCYGQKSNHELLLNYGFCEGAQPRRRREGRPAAATADENPYDTAAVRLPGDARVFRIGASLAHLRRHPAVARRNGAVLLQYRAVGGLRLMPALRAGRAASRSAESLDQQEPEQQQANPEHAATFYVDLPTVADYASFASLGDAGLRDAMAALADASPGTRFASRLADAGGAVVASAAAQVTVGGMFPVALFSALVARRAGDPRAADSLPAANGSLEELGDAALLTAALSDLGRCLEAHKAQLLGERNALTDQLRGKRGGGGAPAGERFGAGDDAGAEKEATSRGGASTAVAPEAASTAPAASPAAADAAGGAATAVGAAGRSTAGAAALAAGLEPRARSRRAHATAYLRGQMRLYLEALVWVEAQRRR